MARVTVEDCITQVPNRFELVIVASQRTRQLSAGAPLTVERSNDRNPVVALREIAEAKVDTIKLKDAALASFRQQLQVEMSDEIVAHLAEETQTLQDYTPELSLTGEPDEEEAALEAEFSELEKNLDIEEELELEPDSELKSI